jgi:alkylation response protein AidB-like acyl-CoA dehydrogenase
VVGLGPDDVRLRGRARAFATDRVLPLAAELDPRGERIPRAFLDEVADAGWFGVTVPEEHGGMGRGMLGYCLVIEELSRAWMSVASVVGRGNSHLDDVLETDEERATYLPRVAAGDYVGALALSEAQAGSDVASLTTTARSDGGDWVIDGAKKWCGFAWSADYILLYARTDDPPDADSRHLGLSAFLVDKERDAFPDGVSGEPVDKIGYHGITTWSLELDGLRVPGDALVGQRGEAFYGLMRGLSRKRVYTAARAVGLARGGLEDATRYAQERVQFGQPIAGFQWIRFTLADMATSVEAARALTLAAARALDAGERVDEQAAMAKLFATEIAERVTSDALQIHGGNGYLHDHAVQRHWRDARLTRIFEGTSEIQRRIISDRLLDGD